MADENTAGLGTQIQKTGGRGGGGGGGGEEKCRKRKSSVSFHGYFKTRTFSICDIRRSTLQNQESDKNGIF